MKAVTPAQMRRIDAAAIRQFGIAGITLMENAGFSVYRAVSGLSGGGKKARICLICGKGNNGGDGLAAARHLLHGGFCVYTYLLRPGSLLSHDARFNLELLKKDGGRVGDIFDTDGLDRFVKMFDYDIAVDAIFGTGFTAGKISEPVRSVISFINKARCRVVSVDIPSGLNGSTGGVDDVAVKADVTVTLGLVKKGLLSGQGPYYAGKLIVGNIGFPESLLHRAR